MHNCVKLLLELPNTLASLKDNVITPTYFTPTPPHTHVHPLSQPHICTPTLPCSHMHTHPPIYTHLATTPSCGRCQVGIRHRNRYGRRQGALVVTLLGGSGNMIGRHGHPRPEGGADIDKTHTRTRTHTCTHVHTLLLPLLAHGNAVPFKLRIYWGHYF